LMIRFRNTCMIWFRASARNRRPLHHRRLGGCRGSREPGADSLGPAKLRLHENRPMSATTNIVIPGLYSPIVYSDGGYIHYTNGEIIDMSLFRSSDPGAFIVIMLSLGLFGLALVVK